MENHQGCKMKFRNQLAVNLVKVLAPVHSYPSSEVNIVDTAFNLADHVVARIQHDIDAASPKNMVGEAFKQAVNEVREKASPSADTVSAPVEPEERRFFLITNEGQLFPNRDESFEAFLTRALFDLEGK